MGEDAPERFFGGELMPGFQLQRLGTVMAPEPGNPLEIEGVLNPAAIRGNQDELYLFPRLVARGNYSRIGIARVLFNEVGDPTGVERMGIALEPEADYECLARGRGGCEDPRITFVEPLKRYVMTYTALSSQGARIAIAISEDLIRWERLGLATFRPYRGIPFDGVDNKDAAIFPCAIPDPSGQPAIGIIHRPLFPGTLPEERKRHPVEHRVDLHRESIWISYCPMAMKNGEPSHLRRFTDHHRLASPVASWERLKIGCGAPPIRCRHGWLLIYHGVSPITGTDTAGPKLRYSAGMMVLSEKHPHRVCYRSSEPVLTPELPQERCGMTGNVVFPTGIDRRDDLGLPDRFDVYYGMADDRIGVARLDVPECLSPGALADHPQKRPGLSLR